MGKESQILKIRILKPRFVIKATQVHRVKTKYNKKIKYKKNLTNEIGEQSYEKEKFREYES